MAACWHPLGSLRKRPCLLPPLRTLTRLCSEQRCGVAHGCEGCPVGLRPVHSPGPLATEGVSRQVNERMKIKYMCIFGSLGAGLASVSCVVQGLVNSLLCKLQRKGGRLRELRRVPRRVCVEARPRGGTGRLCRGLSSHRPGKEASGEASSTWWSPGALSIPAAVPGCVWTGRSPPLRRSFWSVSAALN